MHTHETRLEPSWAMRGCSLVQAKLWLETKTRQQQVSIEIIGPLASTKEHQYWNIYDFFNQDIA